MKLRYLISLTLTLLLSACNFTLAEDITPPPNYVPPTPLPTLGPLYPAQPPSVANGAAIYIEKCMPCHGEKGLGDGEQGIQLGVTMRAFGLAEIARPASPAQYYTAVTRGNIDRFMPPFASLNDQERWDVTAFVLTLHTTPEQIETGRQLFESKCAGCSKDYFENQEIMSALTNVELARIVRQGNDDVPAFGSEFNDDDLWAVAAYLRTLSFDMSPLTTPEPVSVIETPVSAAATPVGTSQALAESEATAIPQPGFGIVSGSIENKTGADLPSDLVITLRGFEHDANDPNAGPLEVMTLDGIVNVDGTFTFDNIEIPTDRIFLVEVIYEGVPLQSGFAVVEEGAQSVAVPALVLYEITTDTSSLLMDDVQFIFEYGSDAVQVYGLYSFRNITEKIILVPSGESDEIPFIKFPEGSSGFGFEPMQDSENFIPTENGFAIPPSEAAYGLIAFSSLPTTNELNFSQTFVLPVSSINVYVPEGMKAENTQMADLGVQSIQEFRYQIYESNSVDAGGTLAFTLTGKSHDASSSGFNQSLLVGTGALGLVLALAGLWMYRQDRKQGKNVDAVEDDFLSPEEVMDAIIALDDLHGMKKISEKAYQKRRAELKEILKDMV